MALKIEHFKCYHLSQFGLNKRLKWTKPGSPPCKWQLFAWPVQFLSSCTKYCRLRWWSLLKNSLCLKWLCDDSQGRKPLPSDGTACEDLSVRQGKCAGEAVCKEFGYLMMQGPGNVIMVKGEICCGISYESLQKQEFSCDVTNTMHSLHSASRTRSWAVSKEGQAILSMSDMSAGFWSTYSMVRGPRTSVGPAGNSWQWKKGAFNVKLKSEVLATLLPSASPRAHGASWLGPTAKPQEDLGTASQKAPADSYCGWERKSLSQYHCFGFLKTDFFQRAPHPADPTFRPAGFVAEHWVPLPPHAVSAVFWPGCNSHMAFKATEKLNA